MSVTAVHPDTEAFWRAIDAAPPGDLVPVGVFADYLAERGDPRAEPMRWCWDTGRVPCIRDGQSYGWSRTGNYSNDGYGPSTALGGSLWAYIKTEFVPEPFSHSYQRVCEAWVKCRTAGDDPLRGWDIP